MKTIELADATQSLATYAKRAGKTPMIVTRNGKPVAAVLKLSNTDWETIALAPNTTFMRIIGRARRGYRKSGGIPARDVKRKFAKA